jgi:Mg2+ and Co2+ transporter CorA
METIDRLDEIIYQANQLRDMIDSDTSKLYERIIECQEKLLKIQELCNNQDLYRGRQALASKILQIIVNKKDNI